MTDFGLLEFIELGLILIILYFLIRYFRSLFIEKSYTPESWKYKVRNHEIPKELIRMERQFQDKARFFNIWLQIERIKKDKIPGSFAELGVYKGITAHLIHSCDPSRKLHLFDTFSGFPDSDLEKETGEAATYSSRNFADTSLEKVKRIVNGNENVIFHQGHFPESAKELEKEKYAFINIDADLYDSIKAGLEFFYSGLSFGGVIIVHDYNHKWAGAIKAVDEFTRSAGLIIIPVPDSQNSIMIFKQNKS